MIGNKHSGKCVFTETILFRNVRVGTVHQRAKKSGSLKRQTKARALVHPTRMLSYCTPATAIPGLYRCRSAAIAPAQQAANFVIPEDCSSEGYRERSRMPQLPDSGTPSHGSAASARDTGHRSCRGPD
jgi:hypothetical protein